MERPVERTVSDVFLDTLHQLGLRYIFANLGTDHAPLVESLAKHHAQERAVPEVVVCPHENTAITAAHGYALATGQGQGVFVHVGVGTQNLGGALQNAWSGRVPMLIFAGKTPLTTRGERLGGRDTPIHYFQDVPDQAGIVRQYCKWEFNLELPEQAAYAFHRGLRLMQSEPTGAIYLTAAREILAAPAPDFPADGTPPPALPVLGALGEPAAARLVQALAAARRPLVITSYLGRRPEAVASLVALCERLLLPVVESAPTHLNFPRTHPQHWGYLNLAAVKQADLILLIDTDVPWMARATAPAPGTPVVQLDVDPLKRNIVLWDFPVTESHWVDAGDALRGLLEKARRLPPLPETRLAERRAWLAAHAPPPPPAAAGERLTVAALSTHLGQVLDEDAVVYDEGVTNADAIRRGTRRTRPGTYFGLPGGGLGWAGGAAMGHKLAQPERQVVSLTGDGAYLFGVPSSLYLTAQRYRLPFLTIIYNNLGWNAVKGATDRMYGPQGYAARRDSYHQKLPLTEHLEQVAEAFGCYGAAVETLDELDTALGEARQAIEQGRAAVINARLEPA